MNKIVELSEKDVSCISGGSRYNIPGTNLKICHAKSRWCLHGVDNKSISSISDTAATLTAATTVLLVMSPLIYKLSKNIYSRYQNWISTKKPRVVLLSK